MTREEARTALGDRNNLLWGMSKEEQKYYSEALDMAISALSENKGELTNEKAIAFLQDNGWLVEHDRIMTSGINNKGEWIPVSERLPEKNTRCLVAVGLFNLTQMATYSNLMGTIDRRIFYQGDYGRENFEDITEYVKAWQPLPEPYKKGE